MKRTTGIRGVCFLAVWVVLSVSWCGLGWTCATPFPTDTPTNTPTDTPTVTNTPTATPTRDPECETWWERGNQQTGQLTDPRKDREYIAATNDGRLAEYVDVLFWRSISAVPWVSSARVCSDPGVGVVFLRGEATVGHLHLLEGLPDGGRARVEVSRLGARGSPPGPPIYARDDETEVRS